MFILSKVYFVSLNIILMQLGYVMASFHQAVFLGAPVPASLRFKQLTASSHKPAVRHNSYWTRLGHGLVSNSETQQLLN